MTGVKDSVLLVEGKNAVGIRLDLGGEHAIEATDIVSDADFTQLVKRFIEREREAFSKGYDCGYKAGYRTAHPLAP